LPRSARQQLHDYSVLFKTRITGMVVLTAWCGAYLAMDKTLRSGQARIMAAALVGIGLVAAGTAAANQVVERESDAKMSRTAQRPLVTGSIKIARAIAVTLALIIGGTLLLALAVNPLTALLAVATSVAYIAIYTPLKKVTPLCTTIGAVPGAMPIILGWVAVRGRIDWQAAALFAILFLWQFPHFYAISLLHAEDYRRAGIRMLPVVEPDGASTRFRIVIYSLAMFAASLIPTLFHMAGTLFGVAALALAFPVVGQSFRIAATQSGESASRLQSRRMLLATVIYLPLLMIGLALDHAF
jgi:heme o synthase